MKSERKKRLASKSLLALVLSRRRRSRKSSLEKRLSSNNSFKRRKRRKPEGTYIFQSIQELIGCSEKRSCSVQRKKRRLGTPKSSLRWSRSTNDKSKSERLRCTSGILHITSLNCCCCAMLTLSQRRRGKEATRGRGEARIRRAGSRRSRAGTTN
jgi:hypothetical protein